MISFSKVSTTCRALTLASCATSAAAAATRSLGGGGSDQADTRAGASAASTAVRMFHPSGLNSNIPSKTTYLRRDRAVGPRASTEYETRHGGQSGGSPEITKSSRDGYFAGFKGEVPGTPCTLKSTNLAVDQSRALRPAEKSGAVHGGEFLKEELSEYKSMKTFTEAANNKSESGRYAPLAPLLYNEGVECPHCKKFNAKGLQQCGGCSTHLDQAQTDWGENLLVGMALGIQTFGANSRDLSLHDRYETPEGDATPYASMIFDDLAGASTLHLNAVPTSHFVPDWRYLLNDPSAGLVLLQQLKGEMELVLENDFYNNEQWKDFVYANDPDHESLKQFDAWYTSMTWSGCNFPPSQSQLHVQHVAAPLNPFDHNKFMNDGHFNYKRWFPLDYIEAVLKKQVQQKSELGRDHFKFVPTDSIDKIINFFNARDVNYYQYWQEQHSKIMDQSTKYQMDKSKFCFWRSSTIAQPSFYVEQMETDLRVEKSTSDLNFAGELQQSSAESQNKRSWNVAFKTKYPEEGFVFGDSFKKGDDAKLITRLRVPTEDLKYLQCPRDPEIRFANEEDKSVWFQKLGMPVPKGMTVPEASERDVAVWKGITIWKGVVPVVPTKQNAPVVPTKHRKQGITEMSKNIFGGKH